MLRPLEQDPSGASADFPMVSETIRLQLVHCYYTVYGQDPKKGSQVHV